MAKKEGAKKALRSTGPLGNDRKRRCKGQMFHQRSNRSNMYHGKNRADHVEEKNSTKRKRIMENTIAIDSDSDDDRVGNTSLEEIKKHGNSDAQAQHFPCAGSSVPSPPPVEQGQFSATPLLVHCPNGKGGVQGLNWYAKSLRIDENNDVAHEFLVEVSPAEGHNKRLPKFEVDRNTRCANVTNKILKRYFQYQATSEEDALTIYPGIFQ